MNELGKILEGLDQRLCRIEGLLTNSVIEKPFHKEWHTVAEAAKLLGKQPFTIREWCRLGRIEARKRKCGRGRTSEWIISSAEIQRYLNEGLLPQAS